MAAPTPRKRSASGPQQSGRAKRRHRPATYRNKVIADDASNGKHVVAKNSRACLSTLPEELVVNIFRHLDTGACSEAKVDRDSLANLCRVNKYCNRIATEVLYEEIPENQRAVRRVARNRFLAKHVKVLGLHFGVTKTSKSIEVLRKENVRALQNACNVRELAIYEHQKLDLYDLLWVNFLDDAMSSNQFAHLKSLAIDASGLRVEQLSCVFRIPSLETLRLRGAYPYSTSEDWTIPAQSCNIQSLDLFDSFMDINAIANMISATKALKEFEYYYNPSAWEPLAIEDNPMSQWPTHSWTVLGKALSRHKESLERLIVGDLSDTELVASLFPDGRKLGTLGSLREFPNLTTIAAPLDAFLDIERNEDDLSTCLPASLTNLILWCQSKESISACSAPVIGSLQKLPGLKDLNLNFAAMFPFTFTFPFTKIRLSEPLFRLKAAGIIVSLSCDSFGTELTLDDIMELEAGRLMLI